MPVDYLSQRRERSKRVTQILSKIYFRIPVHDELHALHLTWRDITCRPTSRCTSKWQGPQQRGPEQSRWGSEEKKSWDNGKATDFSWIAYALFQWRTTSTQRSTIIAMIRSMVKIEFCVCWVIFSDGFRKLVYDSPKNDLPTKIVGYHHERVPEITASEIDWELCGVLVRVTIRVPIFSP